MGRRLDNEQLHLDLGLWAMASLSAPASQLVKTPSPLNPWPQMECLQDESQERVAPDGEGAQLAMARLLAPASLLEKMGPLSVVPWTVDAPQLAL